MKVSCSCRRPVRVRSHLHRRGPIRRRAVAQLPVLVATPRPERSVRLHNQRVVDTRGRRRPVRVRSHLKRDRRWVEVNIGARARAPIPERPVRLDRERVSAAWND